MGLGDFDPFSGIAEMLAGRFASAGVMPPPLPAGGDESYFNPFSGRVMNAQGAGTAMGGGMPPPVPSVATGSSDAMSVPGSGMVGTEYNPFAGPTPGATGFGAPIPSANMIPPPMPGGVGGAPAMASTPPGQPLDITPPGAAQAPVAGAVQPSKVDQAMAALRGVKAPPAPKMPPAAGLPRPATNAKGGDLLQLLLAMQAQQGTAVPTLGSLLRG